MDISAPRRPPQSAKAIIDALLALPRQSPQSISEALDGRVSPRTIYRWAKGEHAPQRAGDLAALVRLAQSLGVEADARA